MFRRFSCSPTEVTLQEMAVIMKLVLEVYTCAKQSPLKERVGWTGWCTSRHSYLCLLRTMHLNSAYETECILYFWVLKSTCRAAKPAPGMPSFQEWDGQYRGISLNLFGLHLIVVMCSRTASRLVLVARRTTVRGQTATVATLYVYHSINISCYHTRWL